MNCFCGMVDWLKAFSLISSQDYCQRSSPLRIWHAASRVWTCAECKFRRLFWMKLGSSDKYYAKARVNRLIRIRWIRLESDRIQKCDQKIIWKKNYSVNNIEYSNKAITESFTNWQMLSINGIGTSNICKQCVTNLYNHQEFHPFK